MSDRILHISTSPHLSRGIGTNDIMRNVVWALLPVTAFAIYAFGLNVLLLLLTTTGAAVWTEHMLCRWSGKASTVNDWSAVISGLLLGLTLPPTFPLWMGFVGAVIGIGLGKYAFGGLGYNVFNPALVGRAVLQAAFPVAITTWYPPFQADRFSWLSASTASFPFAEPGIDAVSGATPLALLKFDGTGTPVSELALGMISGSAGETCAVLIILGGLYLIARKMMNWRIPAAMLGSVYVLSGILYLADPQSYPSPEFMLFSGGLMLGAVFMATDMVASPVTPLGVVLYGSVIGILVVVIRIWGGLPEGVMYAILLGNALSPHIDRMIRPRVYGTKLKTASR